MTRALELARQSPRTHPNPRVGAVIVDSRGVVIGEGHHPGPGHDHAEIVALNDAGEQARGSTMFVSLEPCSHHGRTPPCTDALIAAGLKQLVVAIEDPDERVAGKGLEQLRHAGVEVELLEIADLARGIDPAYFRHRETGMPAVTMKWAMTLDGSIAAADGSSQWITSESARREVHVMRAQSDAVVIGAGTLRIDDPSLTVRLDGYEEAQPVPVVIAGANSLPRERRIWQRQPIVVSTEPLTPPAGELVQVAGSHGRPDPKATCRALAKRGLLSLLLEGGPSLGSSWWNSGVVTNGVVWVGAKVGGGAGMSPMTGPFTDISSADVVSIESVRNVGGDVVITFQKK